MKVLVNGKESLGGIAVEREEHLELLSRGRGGRM